MTLENVVITQSRRIYSASVTESVFYDIRGRSLNTCLYYCPYASYQACFVRGSYDTSSLNGGVPAVSTIDSSASCLQSLYTHTHTRVQIRVRREDQDPVPEEKSFADVREKKSVRQ